MNIFSRVAHAATTASICALLAACSGTTTTTSAGSSSGSTSSGGFAGGTVQLSGDIAGVAASGVIAVVAQQPSPGGSCSELRLDFSGAPLTECGNPGTTQPSLELKLASFSGTGTYSVVPYDDYHCSDNHSVLVSGEAGGTSIEANGGSVVILSADATVVKGTLTIPLVRGTMPAGSISGSFSAPVCAP